MRIFCNNASSFPPFQGARNGPRRVPLPYFRAHTHPARKCMVVVATEHTWEAFRSAIDPWALSVWPQGVAHTVVPSGWA